MQTFLVEYFGGIFLSEYSIFGGIFLSKSICDTRSLDKFIFFCDFEGKSSNCIQNKGSLPYLRSCFAAMLTCTITVSLQDYEFFKTYTKRFGGLYRQLAYKISQLTRSWVFKDIYKVSIQDHEFFKTFLTNVFEA